MAEVSGISWTDSTFNPWIGCARVSPACDGCYAAALMGEEGRHKRAQWGGPGAGAGTRVRTAVSTWREPRRWNKKAAASGRPHFVFCASLADVFDNEVPLEWRQDLFALIRETPHLTWLLLTKRPGMIERLWFKSDGSNPWPENAAIGCTVVNQEEADRDVRKLLSARAGIMALSGGLRGPAFTFLSMEPLLGPVDLRRLPLGSGGKTFDALKGTPRIDWVITGGETTQGAHRARPQNPRWFREIRDQCEAAGVPFHHKQNGEWAPGISAPSETAGRFAFGDYTHDPDGPLLVVDHAPRQFSLYGSRCRMTHVGKDRAGRLLDGVTHDARPEVRP